MKIDAFNIERGSYKAWEIYHVPTKCRVGPFTFKRREDAVAYVNRLLALPVAWSNIWEGDDTAHIRAGDESLIHAAYRILHQNFVPDYGAPYVAKAKEE